MYFERAYYGGELKYYSGLVMVVLVILKSGCPAPPLTTTKIYIPLHSVWIQDPYDLHSAYILVLYHAIKGHLRRTPCQ